MTCRKILVLMTGVLVSRCLTAASQGPAQPSYGVPAHWQGPSSAQSPLDSPQAAPGTPPSHLPGPQRSPGASIFSGPVGLERLVAYALANNPGIQAARYHARAQGARVPQAASLPDPQLGTTVFLDSIETAAGPQEVAMSLSQKLPWFGKRGLRSQVAYHDAMAAYARVTVAELEVVEQVKHAYFDLYFLQHAIAESRALQPQLQQVIEIAREKHRTNQAGLESLLQAEIELAKLKTRLVQQEQAEVEAQARLAAVLHSPGETRIEAVPKLDRTRLAHTAEVLRGLAESFQPELEAHRREVCRDRSATALACRGYWPDVTVGLNWYEIGAGGLSPLANGADAYSLGIGLNLPVYRGRLDAAVLQARHEAVASARRYAAGRDRVRSDVEALHAQFMQHHRILEILESEILSRAGQTLELSIEAYLAGRLEFQQLIDAYRTLLGYRIEYHRRETLREQAIASLERAVGCAIAAEPGSSGDQKEALAPAQDPRTGRKPPSSGMQPPLVVE